VSDEQILSLVEAAAKAGAEMAAYAILMTIETDELVDDQVRAAIKRRLELVVNSIPAHMSSAPESRVKMAALTRFHELLQDFLDHPANRS
jgi:hypothetical protein